MTDHSIADAERELLGVLDRAPAGAIAGEWRGTTVQAGHSKISGGYVDTAGADVEEPGDRFGRRVKDAIRDVIRRVEAGSAQPFNIMTVRWTKRERPWRSGRVAIVTEYDEAIVPRGPDDPVYETAAAARRRFWSGRGDVAAGFAEDRSEMNGFAQTRWFGPHRRVLLVRRPGEALLVTDGLSTPWAGVPTRENGVGCELVLRLGDSAGTLATDSEAVRIWADVLVRAGDLVADGYRVANEVETESGIVLARLPETCRPAAHLILSVDQEHGPLDGLPFGPAQLLRATALTERDVATRDAGESWAALAARHARADR